MPNGTGLMGGTSSTQSSLIVPLPGSDSIYYVFTSDEYQSYPNSKGYRYSIVDMCLDSGNGDVISGQKNILLCDSSTEKLSACEDATGTGYWIMGHKMFSTEFQAWHLTSGGITDTVISNIGTLHGWNNPNSVWMNGAAQGEMKFNSGGTKLALAISNFDPAYLDLFDFNNSTGVVSNFCHMVIDSVLNKRIYGVEFSPDGLKLYATLAGGFADRRIYQFNLSAGGGNCDSIWASKFLLFKTSYGAGIAMGTQLAPDGKIYMISPNNDLSCVNSPNLMGFSTNYDTSAIVGSGIAKHEFPNFIAGYKYHNALGCSELIGIDEQELGAGITLFPNPSTGSFTIQTNTATKITGIEVFNVIGEIIYTTSPSSNSIKVHISKEPEGVYFVQLKTAVGVVAKKIVVQQ